jgi:hypothetical protein
MGRASLPHNPAGCNADDFARAAETGALKVVLSR